MAQTSGLQLNKFIKVMVDVSLFLEPFILRIPLHNENYNGVDHAIDSRH